jgi:hypothetical protein
MQNFGRGMWRRVGDYQKQQQQQEQQTSKLMKYMQLQKQRAIDAYNLIKKPQAESDKAESDKTEEVKEEVTIVELISDPEPECASEQEQRQEQRQEVEVEVEVIRQPENVMNDDITVVDLTIDSVSEATVSAPETISVAEETATSKKKRKKNSAKT